ncbi:alkaline phosphatase D family protein [Bdellovibrio sp. HCB337]|uniref:alkaline phosphatase D family protein n=1 Tax=Bdellovibrio sp. HCB337 TaxID=3394358 RepID=UPI0039A58602
MMKFSAMVLASLLLMTSCAHLKGTPSSEPATPAVTPGNGTATPPAATPAAPAKTENGKSAEVAKAPAPKPTVKPESLDKPDTSLHPRGIDFGATIRTIAFGSGANQDLPQPLWNGIAANNPDLFLFMGDSVKPGKDAKSLKAAYAKMDLIPEYRAFREKVPFMATWDDQDYNAKDFVKYWTYVGNSTSFGQKGIYHSKIIGPKKKQVQIIMLDTRSFKTAPDDPKATILGDMQWDWFEAQLKRQAQVRIIVTSFPLIPAEHGTDKWGSYPKERQRFFDLLKKTGANNLFVASGDRRQSSISKTGVKDWGMLFEVTASPINEPAAAAEDDASFEGQGAAVESFGYAQIDWQGRKMSLQIRDGSNKVLNSVSFKIR